MKLFKCIASLVIIGFYMTSCSSSSGCGGNKFLGKWAGYVWKNDTLTISKLPSGLYFMKDVDPKVDGDTLKYQAKEDELVSYNQNKGYDAEIKYIADSSQIILNSNGMRLGTMKRLK